MAKSVADAVLDAALNVIKTTGVLVTVCNAEPTTYAQASATYKLADVVSASGDFTIANGDTSGRKVTVGQFAAVPVDTTGTATHIAICSGSALLYVTTCTSQALTSGNTVTIPAWKIEIADPS
jgi:hypothetical protein